MGDKIMYELFVVLIRQLALVGGTYLVTNGAIDGDLLEPLVGLSLALFSVGWMAWDRFIQPKWFK